MSKGQHGNKEAKKPKMVKPVAPPLTPGGLTPIATLPVRQTKKR
jgi:hypothetical protein